MSDAQIAANFLQKLFGSPYSEGGIYVCSLPNEDAREREPGLKEIVTRKPDEIKGHLARWDRADRAYYFCISTIRPGADPPPGGKSVRCKANSFELPAYHADVDLKDVPLGLDAVLARILALPIPPSLWVFSGNGLHLYWLLSEAILVTPETMGEVEADLRLLADLVGGDLSCAEVARLMRLPGSHNTKRGEFKAVTFAGSGARYHVEDLREMLASKSPVVARKAGPERPVEPGNHWTELAAQYGRKPPIDVDSMLAAVTYQGPGDSAVHRTELLCTASLVGQGWAIDEASSYVLAGVQTKVGADAINWNWEREERKVIGMCRSAQAKFGERVERVEKKAAPLRLVSSGEGRGHGGGAQTKKKPRAAGGDDADHIVLARVVLDALRTRGEQLLFTPKAAWRYEAGLWTMMVHGANEWLNAQLEQGCQGIGLKSANRLINEARGWICRQPDLWRDDVPWDQHGKVPTRSGLVDPDTLELEPIRPDHYCTWRVEAEFAPEAECPRWQRMIADTFSDRNETTRAGLIAVIQELLGAGFVDSKPRSLAKGLILQGGSNAGKTQLIEVLSGMFGNEPITVSLDSVDAAHGTMPFLRRAPWTLHEAFEQSKWHLSSTVKALVTGEPIGINIKNGPLLAARFRSSLFWGTNFPPQFKESTRAIVNRFVVIECRRVFKEENDLVGVAIEAGERGFDRIADFILDSERSGVLNWGLEGLRRGRKNGRLTDVAEINEARTGLHQAGNLVAEFVEDCVDYDPNNMVSVPDFCAAFSVWWAENKGETRNLVSNDSIGRAVVALANPKIGYSSKELRDERRRYYAGISLNSLGLEYQKRVHEGSMFEQKKTAATPGGEAVNREIPAAWDCRNAVVLMRQAHDQERMTDTSRGSKEVSPAEMCQAFPAADTSDEEKRHESVSREVPFDQPPDPEGRIVF